uniref:Uncharacterized protein n=1 Tax=Aegilops tauschii subsp. strangulata TaxID=200361 RepID=A0A453PAW5_AEGTS
RILLFPWQDGYELSSTPFYLSVLQFITENDNVSKESQYLIVYEQNLSMYNKLILK